MGLYTNTLVRSYFSLLYFALFILCLIVTRSSSAQGQSANAPNFFKLGNSVSVTHDSVVFGRVRLRSARSDSSVVRNISSTPTLYLPSANLNSYLSDTASFDIPSLDNKLVNRSPTLVRINFHPKSLGYHSDTVSLAVTSGAPQNAVVDSVIIKLYGRGVDYNITTKRTDFGILRTKTQASWNSDTTGWQEIAVSNIGDDSISINNIIFASGNLGDFEIVQPQKPLLLDTLGSGKNVLYFKARFIPQFQTVDTGARSALVRIEVADNSETTRSFYDTLYGFGAEPYIVATKSNISFGVLNNPSNSVITTFDTLVNTGSFEGVVDSLRHTNTKFFTITSNGAPLGDSSVLAPHDIIPLKIDLAIDSTGDFYDTIYAYTDSRSQPVVYLHGRIRNGLDSVPPIDMGTITFCDARDTVIELHNSSSVGITIDSLFGVGDTAGFTFPDTANFLQPIHIAADSNYDLRVRYELPIDSLNGIQHFFIVLRTPSPENTLSFVFDTIAVTITRSVTELALQTMPPPYKPSAGDEPFRLPIYLRGSRFGYSSVGLDTVHIAFSNDIIQPAGIDRTGSLTELQGDTPMQPQYFWDSASRSLIIPMFDTTMTVDSTGNDLLFTVLCRTFLTQDTGTSARVSFSYSAKPCGFRVVPYIISIGYANECGNQAIRELLLGDETGISISEPYPNPANTAGKPVSINYNCASDCVLSWSVSDESGHIMMMQSGISASKGGGILVLPASVCPSSGVYEVTIGAYDHTGALLNSVRSKFSVIK